MSATAEALFAELVTLSPANELPERTDYTRDDGTLDEDDLVPTWRSGGTRRRGALPRR